MNLFEQAKKLLVTCDNVKHHNEKRKSGDTKVLTLTLSVDPFDHKLALALSDQVRNTLFKLNHPDPWPHIRRGDFALGVERQKMLVYASSDSPKASIAFDYVKISRISARAPKDANRFVLTFDATFGPCGATELAYVENWRLSQRAVVFEAAEPNLDMLDTETEDDEDDDEKNTPAEPTLPTHEFDTETSGKPLEAAAGQTPPDAPAPPRRGSKPTTH